ncbi:squalene synthase [Hyphomicrobium methylovorum]|uniref:squalene/phytoene synthase family protein n=1 Tax=Hyphomicrobium methylovorum TaxID=84 RepID=UPI0015E74C5F|nr:squalene synthase [Hyphomicrobium methylovorum]
MTAVKQTDANTEVVRSSARAHAPDRFYAALFAPAKVRPDLIAAAAFDGEIAHIARQVTDPALGEIRMAWWRDALHRAEEGAELSGSPVLDAFADVVRRHRLPLSMFSAYFDAHMDALFADAPADEAALDTQFQAIDGTPLRVSLQILTGVPDEGSRELLNDAARAAGYARTAIELPYALAAGRSPLPATWMANAPDGAPDWRSQIPRLIRDSRSAIAAVRRQLAEKPRVFTTALLPLALIEPQFRALQRAGHEPERDIVEIAPLMRLWRVARAHWTGSV